MSELMRKQVLLYATDVEYIESQVKALRQAGERKVSFSEFVRRAVHRYEEAGGEEDPAQLAVLSGQIDMVVSRNTDMLAAMKARNDSLEQTLNELEGRRP